MSNWLIDRSRIIRLIKDWWAEGSFSRFVLGLRFFLYPFFSSRQHESLIAGYMIYCITDGETLPVSLNELNKLEIGCNNILGRELNYNPSMVDFWSFSDRYSACTTWKVVLRLLICEFRNISEIFLSMLYCCCACLSESFSLD